MGVRRLRRHRKAIGKINNPRVREALLPLLEEARTDMTDGVAAVKKFNDQVEVWFDHAMDRVAGWYKRKTQWVLFGIGFAAAVALNVDTVGICHRLAKDPVLRQAMVEAAKQRVAQGEADRLKKSPEEALKELQSAQNDMRALGDMGLPIGWAGDPVWIDGGAHWLTKFAGLLLTALAVSLGAPFWFDILNKLVTVRAAGKAPEERPKNPKEVLQPKTPEDTPGGKSR